MLGRRLKEARAAKGLTQAALAEGKVSRSYIGAVERGEVRPTAENLQFIAERLGRPLSYFLPDTTEVLAKKLKCMLAQAKAYLILESTDEAQVLYRECVTLLDATLCPEAMGMYHEVSAELERRNGTLLIAVTSYMRAAEAYGDQGLDEAASNCTYTAALHLYRLGHLDLALSMAFASLKRVLDNATLSDCARRNHYLIGCCYSSLGNTSEAKNHFALAEEASGLITEMGIKALIAKASCYGRQGNWSRALEEAQKAVSMTERNKLEDLKAEALIGASVSLVNLGQVDKACALLREVVGAAVTPSAKRKACREVMLALSESSAVCESRQYEDELRRLLEESDQGLQSWERVKDEWALAKCSLLRNPQDVAGVAWSFSQSFKSHMRNRDAVEVLTFGASILHQQGDVKEAYELLKEACGMLQRKT